MTAVTILGTRNRVLQAAGRVRRGLSPVIHGAQLHPEYAGYAFKYYPVLCRVVGVLDRPTKCSRSQISVPSPGVKSPPE